MDFRLFKNAVATQFAEMSTETLYTTDVSKDAMWDTYLKSFPPGSNPMFRERTEYDCSGCKQFIRAVGNVVSIKDGKMVTLWDKSVEEDAYNVVSTAMGNLIRSRLIQNRFYHSEKAAGVDKNFEQLVGSVKTWEHFHVNLPAATLLKDSGPVLSRLRGVFDVFLRGLTELDVEVIEIVRDLCKQNSIYRGAERLNDLEKFLTLKREFMQAERKSLFVWKKMETVSEAVSTIRNSAIGTLLIDLSEGTELEKAVHKFETQIMAPSNYKRPTALVTKAQVEAAKATITELGLTSALERRYAHVGDLKITDILFADRTVKSVIEGDVFDAIGTKATLPKLDKIDSVPLDTFLNSILPTAQTVEVLVENKHVGNLVSLIAPVDPTAKRLFKWDNNFSWSYTGDVADSIKEKVKSAGGNVSGELCCRLAWSNFDDLDLHMIEPDGSHIYFGNKRSLSPNGGMLDVDMNAGGGHTRTPVENIFYTRMSKEGKYTLYVHQYNHRDTTDVGFEVEIDYKGDIRRFLYPEAMSTEKKIIVAEFDYFKKEGIKFWPGGGLASSTQGRTVWNIETQKFHPVSVICNSPNYWGREIGNKHVFFMLQDCKNDGQARGFYNEFLMQELDKHRRVIELVGAKMRTDESVNQLSGLGFSTTQRNEVVVRVKGSFNRTLKVSI